jgi:hypothetical protein
MSHRFTLAEANQLLPRIAPLLEEMRELKRRHDAAQQASEALQKTARQNGHALDVDLQQARGQVQQSAVAINAIIEKVKALGAEVKDIEMGLIDFRGEVNGHEVYLCWKLGEPSISWWHDLSAGYAARQPLG